MILILRVAFFIFSFLLFFSFCVLIGKGKLAEELSQICPFIHTPVSDGDVLWYGDVRPGLRPVRRPTLRPVSVRRPSGSPVRPRFPSSSLFSYMLWHTELKFCTWLLVLRYYRSSLSAVTLRQFSKVLCLFVNLEYRKCAVFPHFSLTCFDILSWNFTHDFVLRYYRSSSLLHALTDWAEILHMTCFGELQNKFDLCQFASSLEGIMPPLYLD